MMINQELDILINNIEYWKYDEWDIIDTPHLINVIDSYFENNLLLLVLYVKNLNQYILCIDGKQLYSNIYMCEIKILNITYADWKNNIYVTSDSYIDNSKDFKDSQLKDKYNLIFSNPNILKLVLKELYDYLHNEYSDQLFKRIYNLLIENIRLQDDNTKLYKEYQDELNKKCS